MSQRAGQVMFTDADSSAEFGREDLTNLNETLNQDFRIELHNQKRWGVN